MSSCWMDFACKHLQPRLGYLPKIPSTLFCSPPVVSWKSERLTNCSFVLVVVTKVLWLPWMLHLVKDKFLKAYEVCEVLLCALYKRFWLEECLWKVFGWQQVKASKVWTFSRFCSFDIDLFTHRVINCWSLRSMLLCYSVRIASDWYRVE